MREKDLVLRELFNDPVNFADFLNATLFHGEEVISSDSLKTENSVVSSLVDVGNHQVAGVERVRDVIKCHDDKGTYMILGIENQSTKDRELPLRVLSYDTAGYLNQRYQRLQKIEEVKRHISYLEELLEVHPVEKELEEAKAYLQILRKEKYHPIFTVAFYHGEGTWDQTLSLKDLFDIPPYLEELVNDWKIPVINLEELNIEIFKAMQLKIVFGSVQRIYKSNKKEIDFLKELVITQREAIMISTLAGMPMLLFCIKEQEEGGFSMCRAYNEFVELTRNEGFEIGKEQGIKKGMQLEKRKEVTMIRCLMENTKLSASRAMELLGISLEEQKQFLMLLEQ